MLSTPDTQYPPGVAGYLSGNHSGMCSECKQTKLEWLWLYQLRRAGCSEWLALLKKDWCARSHCFALWSTASQLLTVCHIVLFWQEALPSVLWGLLSLTASAGLPDVLFWREAECCAGQLCCHHGSSKRQALNFSHVQEATTALKLSNSEVFRARKGEEPLKWLLWLVPQHLSRPNSFSNIETWKTNISPVFGSPILPTAKWASWCPFDVKILFKRTSCTSRCS